MCGRGRQTVASAQAVAQALHVPIVFQPPQQQPPNQQQQEDFDDVEDQYSPFNNGAPGRSAPIVIEGPPTEPASMILAKWGLVPSYQSPSTPPDYWRMFNAREDNLVNVHSRLLNTKRCIVPLEGFYEWENRVELGKKRKQPYYLSSASKSQLPMAGLWDTWKDEKGRIVNSFSIITVSPSDDIKWLHDRMPAILRDEEEIRMWLNQDLPFAKVKQLIRPYTIGGLRWWPVTESIGKLGYNGDDCANPVELVKGVKSITSFFGAKKSPVESSIEPKSTNSDSKDDVGGKIEKVRVSDDITTEKGTTSSSRDNDSTIKKSEVGNEKKKVKVSDFFSKEH
jgi:putative SOS response-associated peptidase YedK